MIVAVAVSMVAISGNLQGRAERLQNAVENKRDAPPHAKSGDEC